MGDASTVGETLCALFRSFRRCLFLLPNTLPCFVHCNSNRFLVFVVRVRSRRHQPSCPPKIQLLSSNPNQLVGSDRKANSRKRSHCERCDSKSDDTCNFHDLFCEACCPYIDLNPDGPEKPLRKNWFSFFNLSSRPCALVNTLKACRRVVSNHGKWS